MRTEKEMLEYIVEHNGDCDWPCWACPLHTPNSECCEKNALDMAKIRLEIKFYGERGLGALLKGMML